MNEGPCEDAEKRKNAGKGVVGIFAMPTKSKSQKTGKHDPKMNVTEYEGGYNCIACIGRRTYRTVQRDHVGPRTLSPQPFRSVPRLFVV